MGCALAARAAFGLTAGAGIPAVTIHRLLNTASGDDLDERRVLVVDECGMVGTRQLAAVIELAGHSGAKVVLVGDHRQLPEIAAGGAFAALAGEGALTLRRNRRQVERWEREALAALRDGDPQAAIDRYIAAGRVHVGDDARSVQTTMVEQRWDGRARGDDVLMVAGRNAQIEALNNLARRRLADKGQLGDEIVVGARAFAVGDTVIAGYNDYRLGLLNGTLGTVSAVDRDRGRLTLATTDGRSIDVPRHYLQLGRLKYGYATTVHKAQGATVDATLVLADDASYREAIYTGLSRGRVANHIYVVSDDVEAFEAHAPRPEALDGLAVLRRAVKRSAAQELATPPRRAQRR